MAVTTIAEIELFISQRLLSLRSLESGYMITMIAAIAEVFFFSAIAAITAMVAIIWKPGFNLIMAFFKGLSKSSQIESVLRYL